MVPAIDQDGEDVIVTVRYHEASLLCKTTERVRSQCRMIKCELIGSPRLFDQALARMKIVEYA